MKYVYAFLLLIFSHTVIAQHVTEVSKKRAYHTFSALVGDSTLMNKFAAKMFFVYYPKYNKYYGKHAKVYSGYMYARDGGLLYSVMFVRHDMSNCTFYQFCSGKPGKGTQSCPERKLANILRNKLAIFLKENSS